MSDSIRHGDVLTLESGKVVKRAPYHFPRQILGHAHIRGRTRQGKTSLTLIAWLYQLLTPYQRFGRTQRSMFAVFDLKGDPNLFHHAQEAASKAGRLFKYLVIDAVPGLDSYHFPPFQFWSVVSSGALATSETIAQAFGQDFGQVWAASYFLGQNVASLLHVCERFSDQNAPPDFAEIASLLAATKSRKEFKDAEQMRVTFSALARFPQLVPHADAARNIDIRQAIEEGHVLYFWCRTLRQAMSARFVAGLALYSIIAIAMERSTLGLEPRHSYVAIDEFQELVSRSIGNLMAQCGAWLSLILLNQSNSQLRNRDLSIADFVAENASFKQYFTCVGEDEIKTLQTMSREKRIVLGGGTSRGLQTSQNYHEVIVPSLDADTIREVSGTFGRSFVVVDDGQGHKDPQIIEQRHEYPDYSNQPMPRRPTPAAGAEGKRQGAYANATTRGAGAGALNAAWQAKLEALWKKKRADEASGIME